MRDRIAARTPFLDLPSVVRWNRAERESLRELAFSRFRRDRELCVGYLQCSTWDTTANLSLILELAERLMLDPTPNVRWGVLVAVEDFAEYHPQRIWPFLVKWGSVLCPDIRAGIACLPLEQLLGYHWDEYFARSKAVIESGNMRFAHTLSICYVSLDGEPLRGTDLIRDYLGTIDSRRAGRRVRSYKRSLQGLDPST